VTVDEVPAERRAIGHRILLAAKKKGIKQSALGEHFGKVPSAINGWISGRTQPSLEEFAELCRLTGADPRWILGVGGQEPINESALHRALSRARQSFDEIAKAVTPEAAGEGSGPRRREPTGPQRPTEG
jgi:transcriptional regulator with XRE-family HTH domain